MKKNNHIEKILQNADKIAKDNKHEYVTTEHILIAMVKDKEFRNIMIDYGVQVSELESDLQKYIIDKFPKTEKEAKRSHILEKTFNQKGWNVTKLVNPNKIIPGIK